MPQQDEKNIKRRIRMLLLEFMAVVLTTTEKPILPMTVGEMMVATCKLEYRWVIHGTASTQYKRNLKKKGHTDINRKHK